MRYASCGVTGRALQCAWSARKGKSRAVPLPPELKPWHRLSHLCERCQSLGPPSCSPRAYPGRRFRRVHFGRQAQRASHQRPEYAVRLPGAMRGSDLRQLFGVPSRRLLLMMVVAVSRMAEL
jgi:hypothetical protein